MFMDKQIFHGEVTNILSDRRETLLVDVTLNPKEGQRQVLVELRFGTDDGQLKGKWAVATMCPADANALAEFLWDASGIAAHLDEEPRAGIIGARQLPVITICGKRFFIDGRLRQLRNVDDPGHSFDLDESGI